MLNAHRPEIELFVSALFRYADEDSYVSLRAFDQFDRGKRAVLIQGIKVGHDLNGVVAAATLAAERAANLDFPAVFAPPVATFKNPNRATGDDLACGVAISVEVDSGDARAAQQRLEGLLGPVTIVVASGGEWFDPDTGVIHPKLHLHWRLSEVTNSPEEHSRLQQARWLAAVLVGADKSAAPPVHPLRWPGSWNRKTERAQMAMGVGGNLEAEVHLDDALAALETAVEASGLLQRSSGPHVSGTAQAPLHVLVSAMTAIPNPDLPWDEWNRIGMTMWRATGAAPEGLAAWEDWSAKSTKHSSEACAERWAHYGNSPPSKLGAGTIIYLAQREGWIRPFFGQSSEVDTDLLKAEPSPDSASDGRGTEAAHQRSGADRQHREESQAGKSQWGLPLNFFTDQNRDAPALLPEHVPAVVYDYAIDLAERMGVDPVSVVMAQLVSIATVLTDDWRVQPKRFDYTWTEQPRLWAAIVGPPSILKSPVLAACTKPIELLEEKARKRHAEAMRQFKRRLKEFKEEVKSNPDAIEPVMPKKDRYMVEGTTTEALSEVLRDDEDATMNAPAGKVLVRQDELSEFFGNFDRYKAGGKGGGDRGAYLRLFNGGRYTVDRIQRGSFVIPNWSACFVGGIQPAPMQRLARGQDDDGMLQRFLYVVPSAQGYGADRAPNSGVTGRYANLFPALVALSPPRTVDGEHFQTVSIHQDGHQDREDVNQIARAMAALHGTLPRLQAAFGKWPGLFARLSLIFHLTEIADARASGALGQLPPTLIIKASTTAMVARFMCEIVLPHLLRADTLMFKSAQASHIERIAGWILINKREDITVRDILRNYRPLSNAEDRPELMSVMATLSLANWLEPVMPANPAKSINEWKVNPAVHGMFGHYAELEAARREALKSEIEAAKSIKAGRRAEIIEDEK